MNNKLSVLWVLIAAILWGTTGTAQTLAPENVSPIAIGATRLAVGGLSLLVILLMFGQWNIRKLSIKATLIAALCMAMYQPLFFSAVHVTGVAVGTVIAIGSAPILSGCLEWLLQRKMPTKVWWIATCLSIIGCLLLFLNGDTIIIDPLGVIMALGAGLAFASYTYVSKQLVAEHSSLVVVAIVFTLSAIILLPCLFIFDMSWIFEARGFVVSLHLGIIATGVAYLLFSKGLSQVNSSTAVTLSLAEPLTAALLGVFFVGEYLTYLSWIGIGLIFIGITLLAFTRKVPNKREVKIESNFVNKI